MCSLQATPATSIREEAFFDPHSHDGVFAPWTFSQCVVACRAGSRCGLRAVVLFHRLWFPRQYVRLRLRCGGRSWHSSLTNSNSQQSDIPGHDEQPQTDLYDGDYAASVKKVLFLGSQKDTHNPQTHKHFDTLRGCKCVTFFCCHFLHFSLVADTCDALTLSSFCLQKKK